MPRQLQTDRWMFGSTLALCLVGAIMVFSASAVMARDQYGNGSHFLLRQLLWLACGLGGMMAVMNLDYRQLRRPGGDFLRSVRRARDAGRSFLSG